MIRLDEFLYNKHAAKREDPMYWPADKMELVKIIQNIVSNKGMECSLNMIDTSNITDFSYIFSYIKDFNGDISKWNVSKGTNFEGMFLHNKKFQGNISAWDMSSAKSTVSMFEDTIFNGNISKWHMGALEKATGMFKLSKFDGDLSDWDVKNLQQAGEMFKDSEYSGKKGSIENWNVRHLINTISMFSGSKLDIDLDSWGPKLINLQTCGNMFDNCPVSEYPDWYYMAQYK